MSDHSEEVQNVLSRLEQERQQRWTAATDLPLTLTVDQAAKLLGISRGTAYQAVRQGQIPSLRLGRRLVIPTGKLMVLLNGHADEKTLALDAA
jgi:excisionase family DNA binding protein